MRPKPNSSQRKPQRPEQPPTLEQKLQQATADRDHWTQVAASPDLSLPAALAARNLSRSYGAAASLYQKAAAHQAELNDPEAQGHLMRLLGINPLLPDQGSNSVPKNPPSSTAPETFG